MIKIQPGPDQESVWDYPRPPRLERVSRHIEIVFDGILLADTRNAYRVLETSHPPVYYIPETDIQMRWLTKSGKTSLCEWKGRSHYYDLAHGTKRALAVAWGYERPTAAFAAITKHLAFYPAPMDSCTVDGEIVTAQPGSFYGGWITRDIVGPFKGEAGSYGW